MPKVIPPMGPVRRSFLFYAIAFSKGIRQEQGRFSASGRLSSPHLFHQYNIIRFQQSGQRNAGKKPYDCHPMRPVSYRFSGTTSTQ